MLSRELDVNVAPAQAEQLTGRRMPFAAATWYGEVAVLAGEGEEGRKLVSRPGQQASPVRSFGLRARSAGLRRIKPSSIMSCSALRRQMWTLWDRLSPSPLSRRAGDTGRGPAPVERLRRGTPRAAAWAVNRNAAVARAQKDIAACRQPSVR